LSYQCGLTIVDCSLATDAGRWGGCGATCAWGAASSAASPASVRVDFGKRTLTDIATCCPVGTATAPAGKSQPLLFGLK
jgi:hypothetical protein